MTSQSPIADGKSQKKDKKPFVDSLVMGIAWGVFYMMCTGAVLMSIAFRFDINPTIPLIILAAGGIGIPFAFYKPTRRWTVIGFFAGFLFIFAFSLFLLSSIKML